MPDPYPFYPSMRQRDVDLSGLGPDMGDEYTGDSMEDFYDYLLTPRHQRERSQHGAITHYGPSRFASVRPEDAGMAQMIMSLMENKEIHEYSGATRESDLARRAAADEMMMPQGRGGGQVTFTGGAGAGSQEPTRFGAPAAGGPGWAQGMATPQGIQIGGGVPPGPPPAPGPMTERDRMIASGGGYGEESGVAQAEAQGTGYPGHGARGPTMADRRDMGRLNEEIGLLGSEITRMAQAVPGWEGMNPEQVVAAFMTNPKKGDFMREQITAYLLKIDRLNQTYSAGGGQGGGAPVLEFD